MMPLGAVLVFAAGGLAGLIGCWLAGRGRAAALRALLEREIAGLEEQLAAAKAEAQARESRLEAVLAEAGEQRERVAGLGATLEAERKRLATVIEDLAAMTARRDGMQREAQVLAADLAAARADLENEQRHSAQKLAVLTGAREELTNQFKALAGEILEEKSRRFTEQNQANLGQLLDPLKTRLVEFQAKVEEVQKEGIAGRSELKSQLENLQKLNQQLSDGAASLVTALRGSTKTQGDWGEFILEQILEGSGLRQGVEYRMQETLITEESRRARPDVIVNLPGGKHLVLDSKVSLVAYTDYCNAESEASRASNLAAHMASVRTHVANLARKDYHTLYRLRSLDFVVMFIPVEPAFMLAIAEDAKLWQEAYAKNVLLVSPTTLLFVIRTVANLWRQEKQTRNVDEIMRRGVALYDKVVGFVTELEKVGERIRQAGESYDTALQRLKTGPGSVIRQVELLRKLGVKPTRTLPASVVEEQLSLLDEDEDEPLLEEESGEVETGIRD